jgi:hypothetical protein
MAAITSSTSRLNSVIHQEITRHYEPSIFLQVAGNYLLLLCNIRNRMMWTPKGSDSLSLLLSSHTEFWLFLKLLKVMGGKMLANVCKHVFLHQAQWIILCPPAATISYISLSTLTFHIRNQTQENLNLINLARVSIVVGSNFLYLPKSITSWTFSTP